MHPHQERNLAGKAFDIKEFFPHCKPEDLFAAVRHCVRLLQEKGSDWMYF